MTGKAVAFLVTLSLLLTGCPDGDVNGDGGTPTRSLTPWLDQYLSEITLNPENGTPTTELPRTSVAQLMSSLETPAQRISRELDAVSPPGFSWSVTLIDIVLFTRTWCDKDFRGANEQLLSLIPGANLLASAPLAELISSLYTGCGLNRVPYPSAIDETSNRFNDFVLANQYREGQVTTTPAPIVVAPEQSIIYKAACAGFDAFSGWMKEEVAGEGSGGLIFTILLAAATTTCTLWLPKLFT